MYEFDLGMDVTSIKQIGEIKIGTTFHINGCGTLPYCLSSGKTGYGFCLKYNVFHHYPFKIEEKELYFEEKEMHNLFVPSSDWYNGL